MRTRRILSALVLMLDVFLALFHKQDLA